MVSSNKQKSRRKRFTRKSRKRFTRKIRGLESLEDRRLLASDFATLGFDPDGSGAEPPLASTFLGFDWSPGSAYSEDGNTAFRNAVNDVLPALHPLCTAGAGCDGIDNDNAGSEVQQVFVNAKAIAFQTAGGPIAIPAGSEFTTVVAFQQKVDMPALSASPGGALDFDFIAGGVNFVEVYFDDTPDADTDASDGFAGQGFNNGTLIFQGTLTAVQSNFALDIDDNATPDNPADDFASVANLDGTAPDSYPNVDTLTGAGGSGSSEVAPGFFWDPNFFLAPVGRSLVFDDFFGTQQLNFTSSDPHTYFATSINGGVGDGPAPVDLNIGNGVAGVGIGQINLDSEFNPTLPSPIGSNLGGPDIIQEVDANTAFTLLAKLGDFVWDDLNGDGIQDGGEPGVPNVTVELRNATGTVVLDSTTTDGTGMYMFSDLEPGTYTVRFVAPNGQAFTAPNQVSGGDPEAVDSDADPITGITAAVTLAPGEFNPDVDAGLVTPDAKITITPDDTNEVGDDHTFTANVMVDDGIQAGLPGGDGVSGFRDATNAEVQTISITLNGQHGAVPVPPGPFNGGDNNLQATFTSLTGGQVIGNATTTVVVSGVSLDRSTDGVAPNSDAATKTFVDAKIIIDPDGVNPVNAPHTFTTTVWVDDGSGTDAGDGMGNFDLVEDASVTVTLSNQNGAVADPPGPFNGVTDANGEYDVTFTSATQGTVIGHASTMITVGGVVLSRETDGMETVPGSGTLNSDDAVKVFIEPEVKITIEPDDTNEVGDDHIFTVNVMVDDGLPAGAPGGDGVDGFRDADDGTPVTVTLDGINGAVPDVSAPVDLAALDPSVVMGTTVGGDFSVTFSSATAGQVIGHAETTATVLGIDITEETDGVTPNSDDAVKTFVDAKITIEPDDTNEVGDDHTFKTIFWVDDGTDTDLDGEMGTFDRWNGADVEVTLTNQNGAVADPAGPFNGITANIVGDGEFDVTFTSDSAGQVIGNATGSATVGGVLLTRSTDGVAPNSDAAVKTFVDAKITIEPDDTNEVGDDHTFKTIFWVDDGTDTDLDGEMGTFDRWNGADVEVTLTNQNGAVANPAGPFNGITANIVGDGEFDVTFTSDSAGQVIGNATGSATVGGVLLTRSTDGVAPNSDAAVKTFVDAKITIEPDDTNEVGDDHTFKTIFWVDDGTDTDLDGEMGTFDRWNGADVEVTLTNQNGAVADPAGPFNGVTANIVGDGEFDVTFTSDSAGQVIGNATGSATVGGVLLTRSTDGVAPNSDAAVKTFVDAKITIEPDDTNEVGDDHTFKTIFWVDDGTDTDLDGEMGTFDRWNGADVEVTLTNQNGAVANPAGPFNGITANIVGDGEFDVTFTSDSTGQVIGNATGSATVGGVLLTRSTDGVAPNSDAAVKTFVDAKITIEPDDTNEVGDDHTFKTIFWVDDGTDTDLDGEMGTFDRWNGADVEVTLTNQNGAVADPAGPFNGVTANIVGDGEFDVTFTSDSAGQVIGNATGSATVGGVLLTRSTDGVAPNSDAAVKTFVDAKITIEPDDTNEVGDDHTFKTIFWVDDGTDTDLDGEMGTFDRWNGADVEVTLTNQNGAMANPAGPFNGVTANIVGDGEFDVTFTSLTGGQVIGNATGSATVGGVLLTRSTDGVAPNSDAAVKTFVDAKITIDPDGENPVNDPHTFTTIVWVDDGSGTDADGEMGNFDRFEDAPVTVTLANQHGALADPPGPFDGITDVNGEYDVTFTSATAGTVIGHAVTEIIVGGVTLNRETDGMETVPGSGTSNSDDAIKDFFVEDFHGCTPGYWKANAANFARKPDKFGADTDGDPTNGNEAPAGWAPTGVDPGDSLEDVGFDGFEVAEGDETTFVDALNQGGGGENALMRHAAAAYLNAAHPDISYEGGSPQDVVDAVNAALASGDPDVIEDLKDQLDEWNNEGCNIDQQGRAREEGDVTNGDGVNEEDLSVALSNFGKRLVPDPDPDGDDSSFSKGDWNQNRSVDVADLMTIFANIFVPQPAAVAAALAVDSAFQEDLEFDAEADDDVAIDLMDILSGERRASQTSRFA